MRNLFVNHNTRMYNQGKRSRKDYLHRCFEENVIVGVTVAGNLAIWSICPPVGFATLVATTALSALEEYFICPRNEPDSIVIEDIEYVFTETNQLGMRGERLIDVDPEFVEALVYLAQDSNVNYRITDHNI